MLSDNTLNRIIHESNNGGAKSFHPEINIQERKMILRYLLQGGKCLPNCPYCVA